VSNLERNLQSWIDQIINARVAGDQRSDCDAKWDGSKEGKIVKKILRKAAFGSYIDSADLSTAVAAITKLLASNSTTLDTEASNKLKAAYLLFKDAIFYARDSSEVNRELLYNERQFRYPGSFEGNDPSNPEARVQNMLAITRMGNIGQTMRSYAITRYNLDLDIFWSRLQNSIQTNATTYFGVLQDVKVQVDCLVSLVWLSAIFSLVFTPWMFINQMFFNHASVLEFAVAGAAGLLSLGLYSLACSSYEVFADVMRGAVDLFRFKLLDDLHLGLPNGLEEERFLWERLWQMIFAPRPVLGALWLGALVVGGCLLHCHPAKETQGERGSSAFVAKHTLPENYRIGNTDLDWNSDTGKSLHERDFRGKYTAKEIAAGGAVTVGDLRIVPAIKSGANREASLLPLNNQPELIEALNAGSKVNLFEDNQLVLKQVPILALLCDAPAGSNCTAIMDLDRNEARIYAHVSAKLRIVLGQP
jgi:hypothetical protein